jgi:hypothetical protein
MKIIQIAEGAFFVPSYSEQTIMRAYTTDATLQSFGFYEHLDDYNLNKTIETQEPKETVGPTVQAPWGR